MAGVSGNPGHAFVYLRTRLWFPLFRGLAEQPADRRIVKRGHYNHQCSRKTDLAYQGNLRDDGYWAQIRSGAAGTRDLSRKSGGETRLTYNGLCYLKQLF